MIDIVVLGTGHPIQCGCKEIPTASIDAFRAELKRSIVDRNIAFVAEEMSQRGLSNYRVDATVGHGVAASLGLDHLYVDLEVEDKSRMAMTEGFLDFDTPTDVLRRFRDAISTIHDELRERVWLCRILECRKFPVLFICGAAHVTPFLRLVLQLGLKCEVAHSDFQPRR